MENETIQIQQVEPVGNNSQVVLPAKIEIGTITAIISVAATLIAIGAAWGTLRNLVKGIDKTLDKDIKPDLKDVRERFIVVEERVDTLWKDRLAPAHSPRQLNERGQSILIGSGIKEIIDGEKDQLLTLVKEKKITNVYDAEEIVLSVVREIPKHCPDIVEKLKKGAFSVGADIDAVLFVGGMYLRNKIFSELGFSIEDLDKPKN